MEILRSHLGPTVADLLGEEDWVCGGGGETPRVNSNLGLNKPSR